jgi:hypothetical protein
MLILSEILPQAGKFFFLKFLLVVSKKYVSVCYADVIRAVRSLNFSRVTAVLGEKDF